MAAGQLYGPGNLLRTRARLQFRSSFVVCFDKAKGCGIDDDKPKIPKEKKHPNSFTINVYSVTATVPRCSGIPDVIELFHRRRKQKAAPLIPATQRKKKKKNET